MAVLRQVQELLKGIGLQGQLPGSLRRKLFQLSLRLPQGSFPAVFRLRPCLSHNLCRLCLGLGELLLRGLLNRLLRLDPGLMDLLRRAVQLRLILRFDLFRLRQLRVRLGVQILIIRFPLLHELLHRLEKKEVQPAGQDRKVHPVEQNLLVIDIQRNIHAVHLPYNTKIISMTTSSA